MSQILSLVNQSSQKLHRSYLVIPPAFEMFIVLKLIEILSCLLSNSRPQASEDFKKDILSM